MLRVEAIGPFRWVACLVLKLQSSSRIFIDTVVYSLFFDSFHWVHHTVINSILITYSFSITSNPSTFSLYPSLSRYSSWPHSFVYFNSIVPLLRLLRVRSTNTAERRLQLFVHFVVADNANGLKNVEFFYSVLARFQQSSWQRYNNIWTALRLYERDALSALRLFKKWKRNYCG